MGLDNMNNAEDIDFREESLCPYCGAPLKKHLATCEYCGQVILRQIEDGSSEQDEISDLLSTLLRLLPESPLELNRENTYRIQRYFPVPTDFSILWADVNNFSEAPFGIVVSNQALIIKTSNVRSQDAYHCIPWYELSKENIRIDQDGNLLINNEVITKCYSKSVEEAFHKILFSGSEKEESRQTVISNNNQNSKYTYQTDFNGKYGSGNSTTGHGNYFEEVGTKLDVVSGTKAEFVGSDFVKNGKDKNIYVKTKKGEIKKPVQCKCCNTPNATIQSAFERNPETNQMEYRYYQNGKPMKLEVPRDQYDKCVELLKKRILKGQVPGVTNPAVAKNIVRRSKLTYYQSLNLAKSGTIESLAWDSATGIIDCTTIVSLSVVSSFCLTYWKTRDIKESTENAIQSGIEVFGNAVSGDVLASQVARVDFSELFPQYSSPVNGLGKAVLGKSVSTSAMTLLYAVPETYNLISSKISAAQYFRNMFTYSLQNVGAFAVGYTAGEIAEKAVALTGKTLPGYGKIVAIILGGALGSYLSGYAGNSLSDIYYEGDSIVTGRIIHSVLMELINEYLISETELDLLNQRINQDEKKVHVLQKNLLISGEQYQDTRDFFVPYFDELARTREGVSSDLYSAID